MSRNKHRGADEFLDGLKNAEKYMKILEREKRNRAAWDSLEHREKIAAWNTEIPHKSPASRALAATSMCQLPLCGRPTISLMGESLGICYPHGTRIAEYFDIMGEDFQTKLDRVVRIEGSARANRLEQRKVEARKISPGWIYYLLVGDRIKIGYSTDVKRRLRQYPPDSPLLALHPGTKTLEHDMHVKFAGCKAAGREWFLDTPEIRQHITQVINDFGEPDHARYEHRGQHNNPMRRAS